MKNLAGVRERECRGRVSCKKNKEITKFAAKKTKQELVPRG